jgi:hypothetical protein
MAILYSKMSRIETWATLKKLLLAFEKEALPKDREIRALLNRIRSRSSGLAECEILRL